jgi:hypothetical protein
MLGVYWMKAKTAGKQMLTVLRGSRGGSGRFWRALLLPLDLFPNGVVLGVVFLAVTVASLMRAVRSIGAGVAMVGLLSAAAMLLLLESAVIMSIYVPNYHNYLAFYAAFLCLCGGQLVANGIGKLAGIGLERA